ncbi:hypothetical protein EIP91_001491 [Steccherinum ochraceum]|uniref:HIG1 domain-containing protein n=1 Tax=Steccherinum ochraceum TaxID=92696 RepID=A0A4R0RPZ6_9APHY|nr:hypothetical protein EIP91_001491 [Steccherinum ochraceum]
MSKITTQQQRDAQMHATVLGGAKGFFGSLAIAGPTAYILNKRWAYYRALQPSLKALGIIIAVLPTLVISAERAGLRYEREQWTGVGKAEIDAVAARQQSRWEAMSFTEKARDVAARHEYGLIVGGWAASMVGAFSLIMRNPSSRHDADHSWREIIAEEEKAAAAKARTATAKQ